ncbi:DUF881 domain-containing protein [Catenulispora rubra]|uniref:DUF881 domain-containing protein n=1 Tax=Catenulispora rubra TaxID=280293 RepID=UPI0018923598|nr:DUF881 domain-containing protein [Catenulispora rubra]
MQTRPGNEPEPDPQDSADGAEAAERDPFTPKVPPVGEDRDKGEAEADEAEAESGADLAETMDLRSLPEEPEVKNVPRRPKKHAGQMSSETVKKPIGESDDEPDQPEPPAGEQETAEPVPVADSRDESDRPEKPAEPALDETVSLEGSAQEQSAAASDDEAAGEREPSEKPAETVDLRELFPEEPAATEPEAEPDRPELAATVNLRDLLPEGPEDKSSGEQPAEPEPEPPLRRRTPPEGEPLRRRPVPGGQPPRRPGPGQDPRRGPGHPHTNESGPRRRPPSEHAPDGPSRRPVTESRPAAAAASGPAAPAKPAKPASVSLGRRRLLAAFWPPRMSRNQAVVGVLLGALGAALAIQVHATNTSDEILRGARSDDLVNILDEVTSRGQSLDAELRNLETQNAAIRDSADKAQAALAQAQQKAKDLQILAGTVKAKGSGITLTITDPQHQLKSATLLNALEELRAAGAEVVQVDDVRVVVSSSFVDTADGGIALDGRELTQPFVYKVIGDPNTLGPAMQIPGGVVATVKSSPGANATIAPGQVLIDAVVPVPNPDYAKAG